MYIAVDGFHIAMDSACDFPNGQWSCSSDGADQRPALGCHQPKYNLWCCKADARALLLAPESFKRATIYVLTRCHLQCYGLHLIASICRRRSRNPSEELWDR